MTKRVVINERYYGAPRPLSRSRSPSAEGQRASRKRKHISEVQQRAQSLLEYATLPGVDDARERRLSKQVPPTFKNMVRSFGYVHEDQRQTKPRVDPKVERRKSEEPDKRQEQPVEV